MARSRKPKQQAKPAANPNLVDPDDVYDVDLSQGANRIIERLYPCEARAPVMGMLSTPPRKSRGMLMT